jgi:hypothetical protein
VKKTDHVLLIILGFSLLANVYQFWSYRHKASPASPHTEGRLMPPVGAKLADLHLLKLDGGSPDLDLKPGELPIVVYVLSPMCKWCKANWPGVNSLATQLGAKYRFVGVSSTNKDLQAYVNTYRPAFPVYYADPAVAESTIQLNLTPQTLLFSSDGFFVRGWDGAYTGETKQQLSSFFRVGLP